MEKTKSIPQKNIETFGTIVDITKFMLENDIPLHAEIQYEGCGSHSIEFAWEDKPTTEHDGLTGGLDLPQYNKWDYDNAGVPDE